jgi:ribonuclease HI
MAKQHVPSSDEITIYADGACKGNPGGIGGWGAVITNLEWIKEIYGGELSSTNNRMELMAVIQALETLVDSETVVVYTDSTYVQKGISEWIHGWKKRGWRTANKEPVKNMDLWKRLDAATTIHNITWTWVKGHNGDPGNERADVLANKGVESVRP